MTDTPITRSELESYLWAAANILRGSPVDRTDWKSYILPLLFFSSAMPNGRAQTAEEDYIDGKYDSIHWEPAKCFS